MTAHFYLLAESFQNNTNFTQNEIENKIRRLSEDIMLIDKYKDTNKRYVNYTEILPQILYSDVTVQNVICREKQDVVERDVLNLLISIIQKSQETTEAFNEIKGKLSQHNEDECCGLIAFHKIDDIDESLQVIYGKDEWYKFRRYFLSLYPKNADYFIEECAKYFPNLFFHENNKTSIRPILNDCPKKIIYHLSALCDRFREFQQQGTNRTDVLQQFSTSTKLDETATLEGDAERKKCFTFQFSTDNGDFENVCCEPHLKLCYNDNPGNTSYFTNRRIYFHEGKQNIQNGKILIGHIGIHL